MITCFPQRRIFYQEKNGYTVMLYRTRDQIPRDAVCDICGREYSFKAAGVYLPDAEGLTVRLEGEWNDSGYGMQLDVTDMELSLPKTQEGIAGYLSSGQFKGIGPVTAAAIAGMFGEDTFRVMKEEPERLLAVRGITGKRLEEVIKSFEEGSMSRELMAYLAPYRVTPGKVRKIQDHFGDDAYKIIRENPYRLTEIAGMGFLTVDPVAGTAGAVPAHSHARLSAGIRHVLKEAEKEGHLYLDAGEVVRRALTLFGKLDGKVTEEQLKQAGNRMVLKERSLFADRGAIYLYENMEDEAAAARHIARLIAEGPPGLKDAGRYLQAARRPGSIKLGVKQKEAVLRAFESPVSIITGGPGRGKTTVLKTILRIFREAAPDQDALLCAPTGRAGRRMEESTGHAALTIHKALYINEEGEEEKSSGMIRESLIIVDESSMVDMRLARILFSRIRSGSRLVLAGDADQLPSVRQGDVFRELIRSGMIPVTVLDRGYRQKEGSRIMKNAALINGGKTCLEFGSDFRFIRAQSPKEAAEAVLCAYRTALGRMGDGNGIQVLSPVKNQEHVGTRDLNRALQEMLNPPVQGQETMRCGAAEFRAGDRVMQIKNRDEVANGDTGVVESILPDVEGKKVLTVCYPDGRCQKYREEDLEILQHAYAVTIHKSQGAEYPVVIMPVLKQFYRMLKRNVLYTGVTRASREVCLVGSTEALAMAVRNNDTGKRNTKLAERILAETERAGKKEAACREQAA